MSNTSVMCDIMECKKNRAGNCTRETIAITWKTSGEWDCGERVCYPVCEDFEEDVEEEED